MKNSTPYLFVRTACAVLCLVCASAQSAERVEQHLADGFYTLVDANGNMVVVPAQPYKKSPASSKLQQKASKPNAQSTVQLTAQPKTKQRAAQNKTIPQKKQQPIRTATAKPNKSQSQSQSQTLSNITQAQTPAPTTEVVIRQIYKSKHSGTPVAQTPAKTAPTKKTAFDSETIVFDHTKYIDSEALVNKEFNTEGKRRFYPIPIHAQSGAQVDYVEQVSGVSAERFKEAANFQSHGIKHIERSATYQRINTKTLKTMLPALCVSQSFLKGASTFSRTQVSLWPRNKVKTHAYFPVKTGDALTNQAETEFHAELVSLHTAPNDTQNALSLLSFANTNKTSRNTKSAPSYYWPLAVFLDNKGCAIEAAAGFYLRTLPDTWLQRSALKGNLLIPHGAKYLMLTPLEQSTTLPKTTLSKEGALKLTLLK